MKIKNRLTLIFSILVLIITIISALFSLILLKRELNDVLILELKSKTEEIQNLVEYILKDSNNKSDLLKIKNLDSFKKKAIIDENSLYTVFFVQISDTKNTIFASSPNLLGKKMPILEMGKFFDLKIRLQNNEVYEILYYSYPLTVNGVIRAKLQIGIPKNKSQELLQKIAFYETIEILLSIIISIIVGLIISNSALSPIKNIIKQVKNIDIKDLDKRVDMSNLSMDEVGELAKEFNALLERISKTVKAQNRFISNASHDLRSPLTAIIGHSELLKKRGKNNEKVFDKSSETIISESKRIIKIVDDLLYLAKTGSKVFELKTLELSSILKNVVLNLLPIYTQLSLEEIEENLFIQGDEEAIKRVFVNLINNALVATSEKGTVKIYLTKKFEKIEIIIQDTGIGISQEHLEKIFERFYKVDSARKKASGSGLGLAITEEIILFHKGNIFIESEINKGTIVKVYFPLFK